MESVGSSSPNIRIPVGKETLGERSVFLDKLVYDTWSYKKGNLVFQRKLQ